MTIKSLTVFCGSSAGSDKKFEQEAYRLGEILAHEHIDLIYGGAVVGLMGAVANGVMENGGKAIGVLPHFLQDKEIAHTNLTELVIVNTMHERKTKMNELSDGVIALPGGFGTLEELFEMLTWAQLGLHKKPIAILNTNGFYDELLSLLQNMVEKGFLKPINREMLLVSDDIDRLICMIRAYKAPSVEKWIKNTEV
ncbi:MULTISPECIES: TIGR00730 family Rossman fold protein [Sphingobacterium]|uniref:LOG family protein n=1 Tax=Sphingobacterium TaxID=28453 RepID=UPI0013DC65A3|nr:MULTISPECIES: TIGR00730 family Rossman fold protein [unclassified Sphingobacterium]